MLKKLFNIFFKKESNIHMIIVVVAIVMIWRGVRGILDKILFPEYPIISYLVSIAIWIIILLADNKKLDELSHH